jgi:Outer membrane protein beta-barrel domain
MKTAYITTIIMAISVITYAQKQKKYEYKVPKVTTEVIVGTNFTDASPLTLSNPDILSNKSELGFQLGILRNRKLAKYKMNLTYGLILHSSRQSILYTENYDNYYDYGVRQYNSFYLSTPIELHYNFPKFKYAYLRGGVSTSYVVNNQSTQLYVRTNTETETPSVSKEKYDYRDIKGFDASIRLGGGLQYTTKELNTYRLGASYSHGFVNKDMGVKQHGIEVYLSITLP